MKYWRWIVGVGVLILGAVLYYALSPLFISIKLDDALPPGAVTMMPKEKPGAAQETEESPAPASDSPTLPPQRTEEGAPTFGSVQGTLGHPASGSVRIIEAEGKTFVRYENYKTINGPDIFVYLANDLDAKDFVNLGRVKATEGNINYEVPPDVDASKYRYVLTWCRAFGVLFNYAQLR